MQSIKTRRKEETLPALQEMRARAGWSDTEWTRYYREMYYINVEKPLKEKKKIITSQGIENFNKLKEKTFFQRVKDFISNLF